MPEPAVEDPPSLSDLSLADRAAPPPPEMDSSPEDLVRRYSADVFAFTSKRLAEWQAESKSGEDSPPPRKSSSSPARGTPNGVKPGTPTSPRKER